MPIEFLTTRELNPGKVKVAKLKEEADAFVEYTCPKCGFSEKRREPWMEPLVSGTGANKKFFVKCSKCGYEIKFLKLKKEAKAKK
jgi:predicted nucleic-acid-binding Zn-ribbon protein